MSDPENIPSKATLPPIATSCSLNLRIFLLKCFFLQVHIIFFYFLVKSLAVPDSPSKRNPCKHRTGSAHSPFVIILILTLMALLYINGTPLICGGYEVSCMSRAVMSFINSSIISLFASCFKEFFLLSVLLRGYATSWTLHQGSDLGPLLRGKAYLYVHSNNFLKDRHK